MSNDVKEIAIFVENGQSFNSHWHATVTENKQSPKTWNYKNGGILKGFHIGSLKAEVFQYK